MDINFIKLPTVPLAQFVKKNENRKSFFSPKNIVLKNAERVYFMKVITFSLVLFALSFANENLGMIIQPGRDYKPQIEASIGRLVETTGTKNNGSLIAGICLTVTAIPLIAYSVGFFQYAKSPSQFSGDESARFLAPYFGGALLGAGVLSVGISIPLYLKYFKSN